MDGWPLGHAMAASIGRNSDLADGGGTGEQKLLCWREEDE
jgi:hypothetical protein